MSNTLVVLSGGMDSTALMAYYKDRGDILFALSIDYGQRHRREIESARKVAYFYHAIHRVIDISGLSAYLTGSALTDNSVEVPEGHYAADTMKATIVPNRNAILANIAIGVAISDKCSVMAMGMHAGDHAIYPDCRPVFVDRLLALSEVANEGMNPPRIEAPFVHSSKADIAAIGSDLGAPFNLSWSCYKGGDLHCGICGTCYERREAFKDAGVIDPTEYLDSTTEFAAPC